MLISQLMPDNKTKFAILKLDNVKLSEIWKKEKQERNIKIKVTDIVVNLMEKEDARDYNKVLPELNIKIVNLVHIVTQMYVLTLVS